MTEREPLKEIDFGGGVHSFFETVFTVEEIRPARRRSIVTYRTFFGHEDDPATDHDTLLKLVREVREKGEGRPRALIEVFRKAEKWDKYTLDGKNITPEIIEQIEELEQKLEAIKKIHDRIIDWILHHRAESEKATHWTEEWTHKLPSGAFHRVLDWIRKDLGLPPLEPLHKLSIEDKILEAS